MIRPSELGHPPLRFSCPGALNTPPSREATNRSPGGVVGLHDTPLRPRPHGRAIRLHRCLRPPGQNSQTLGLSRLTPRFGLCGVGFVTWTGPEPLSLGWTDFSLLEWRQFIVPERAPEQAVFGRRLLPACDQASSSTTASLPALAGRRSQGRVGADPGEPGASPDAPGRATDVPGKPVRPVERPVQLGDNAWAAPLTRRVPRSGCERLVPHKRCSLRRQRSFFPSAFKIRTTDMIVFQFRVVVGTPNSWSSRPR